MAYPELSAKFAMKIGKRATITEVDASGGAAFAADAGLGKPLIRRRVSEISAIVLARAKGVAASLAMLGLDAAALGGLAAMVGQRAERCGATFSRRPHASWERGLPWHPCP